MLAQSDVSFFVGSAHGEEVVAKRIMFHFFGEMRCGCRQRQEITRSAMKNVCFYWVLRN